jgi:hypothetical protein
MSFRVRSGAAQTAKPETGFFPAPAPQPPILALYTFPAAKLETRPFPAPPCSDVFSLVESVNFTALYGN